MNLRFAAALSAAVITFAAFDRVPARSQNPMAGLPIDGVRCEATEGVLQHVHAHLQLFDRGRVVPVPAQIGMMPIAGCLYWLHTHSSNGIVHIESPVVRTFTLGQFFDIWGETLTRTQAAGVRASRGRVLRFTVNGRPWTGDPRSIPLRDREEIVVQNGPPYGKPRPADWSTL